MKQRDEARIREIVEGCVEFGEVELSIALVIKLVRRAEWDSYAIGYDDGKAGNPRLDARVMKEPE